MRHKAVVAFALASLALAGNDLLAQGRRGGGARVQDRRPPASSTASIVGRVLTAGTDAPVRRAEVVALKADDDPTPRGRVTTTTDDEGRYQLDRLSPGEWRVTASKGGYFAWQFGQRRPFEIPPPITLARGQQFTADIPLTRGGAISGRVFGEFGEGLAGLQIKVYRVRLTQGYRRLQTVGAADLTDDNGAYRVYGLPPGDYYVAASLRVAPADSVVETTYAPTYFPGTGDLAEAQRVRLALGAEANAIFPLLPFRRVRVSGVVMNSTGAPANAFLNLTSESAEFGAPLGTGGVTRSDGTFTLPDVAPGPYILTATLRGDGPDESASLPVTVNSEDVTGAMLVTGRPATLRGRFVADQGVTRRLPGNLSVIATAARAGGTVLGSDSGSTFEINALSEPFHLSVGALAGDWIVKDIVVNGLSALDSPIELGADQQGDARVVLTDRVTEVSCVVESPDLGTRDSRSGNAYDERVIIVFPDDPMKWVPGSRYVRVAYADASGRFSITGVPPGQYLAAATNYMEDGEHNDPEFLAELRNAAVTFSLDEGEKRSVDVKVVER
jgi:hypothetical protein